MSASALAAIVARYGSGSPDYRASSPPVAVFDWDNTVPYNDATEMMFDRALRRLDLPIGSGLESLLPERLGGRERRAPILSNLRQARAGSKPAAETFRLEMHRLYRDLGTASGSDEQYRWFSKLFAGKSDEELARLAGKVKTIERGIGREPRLVAGDSSGDLPMLRGASAARLVIARDESPASVKAARAEGWIVVTPAELADRSRSPDDSFFDGAR